MKHLRLHSAVVLIPLAFSTSAQFVITTASQSADFSTVRHVSLDDDDNVLLAFSKQGAAGVDIQRFSTDGTVLWSRILDHPNAGNWYGSAQLDDGNGGLWCAIPSNEGYDELSGITTSHIHLCHVDASGNLTDARSYTRTWTTPEFSSTRLAELYMELHPDGGLIVAALGNIKFTIDFLDVLKFQSNGTLEWARNIGDVPALGSEGIPFNLSPLISGVLGPVISSDGTVTIGLGATTSFANIKLFQISALGELNWMREHTYTNSPYYGNYRDIAIDDQDRIHGVGRLSLPTGEFMVLPVYLSDGTWLRTDLCTITDPQTYIYGGSMIIDPDGRRTILNSGSKWATTIIPSLGSSTATHRISTVGTEGSENVTYRWTRHAIQNDMIVRAGVEQHQHNVLAYTTNAPLLALNPIDAFLTCYDSVSTSAMVEVPAAILDLSEPDIYIADIGSWMQGPESSAWTLEESPQPETSSACDAFSGIRSIEQASWIVNSLVQGGQSVQLTEATTGVVDVFSMTGALLQSQRLSGMQNIPTDGWCSGSYLLRLRSNDGRDVRVARLHVIGDR